MSYKVLIVIDGTFTLAPPANTPDFTLTALVNTLVSAGMVVTKANRELDATASQVSTHSSLTPPT